MQKVVTFRANDGKPFCTESACREHERLIKKSTLRKLIKINLGFESGSCEGDPVLSENDIYNFIIHHKNEVLAEYRYLTPITEV